MVYGEGMSDYDTDPIPGLIDPDPRVLSANQLVAYNLMRARRAAGWSQQDVASMLEQLTGRSWSNASVSAAERSWQGGRPRRFDASEILALSSIFNEPIAFFFLPPGPDEYSAEHVGTREFPTGTPDMRYNDEKLSVVSTRAYVEQIALSEPSPSFIMRIQELCRKWLISDWAKPKMTFLGKAQPLVDDGDIDWSAVEETADELREQRNQEVERALSPEHQEAFLKVHADQLALAIAHNLDRMGYLRRDPVPEPEADPEWVVPGATQGANRFDPIEVHQEIGQALLEARVSQGMTREDVAQATRMRPAAISAIEAGDFQALGGPVFVRGHLRVYSKAVNIDPSPLLALFDSTREDVIKKNRKTK